ncbi:MAG: hypothetical protein V1799_07430 [bacterium]
MYLARIAVEEYEIDEEKIGWLRVWYKGALRWAMPVMRFGAFEMPSKEWVEMYGGSMGVWIVGQSTGDPEAHLVWDGFCPLKGKIPQEAIDDFPYIKIFFTENWKMLFSDVKDKNLFVVKHTDGTMWKIDRSKDSETISLVDGRYGNSLVFSEDGVKLNGAFVVLQPTLDWILENAQAFGMGNMGAPVTILPAVVSKANQGVAQKQNFISNK